MFRCSLSLFSFLPDLFASFLLLLFSEKVLSAFHAIITTLVANISFSR